MQNVKINPETLLETEVNMLAGPFLLLGMHSNLQTWK